MPCFTCVKRLSINHVLRHIGKFSHIFDSNGKKYIVRMGTQRLLLFKRSQDCACCGIRGLFFRLDINHGSNVANLNLYGGENGRIVLMTMDHILPRAQRGPTREHNLQVLCADCNQIKAAELLTIEELRKLVRDIAYAKFIKQKENGKKNLIWRNPLEKEVVEDINSNLLKYIN